MPHGVESAKDAEGKALPYAVMHFVFGVDGRLVERQVVAMPAKEVMARETASGGGGTLSEVKAPELAPDVKNFVVLQLPYRSREHVRKTLKIENTKLEDLRAEDALALFAAEFAGQNAGEADRIFRQTFYDRKQRQLGFYVLLAACGQNLDAEHGDVLSVYPNEPLAQYLALYSSPSLRTLTSQWGINAEQWKPGFLQHLAVTHALYQHWQNSKADVNDEAELKRALEHARRNKSTAFGWAILSLIQDRANAEEAQKKNASTAYRTLADAWLLFEEMPGMSYAARYEHARSLWKAGQRDTAHKEFRELYEKTIKEDVLPPIDADFRQVLQGEGREPNLWSELLRETAKRMVEGKHRGVVLILARQCWKLGDQPLANELQATAIAGITEEKELHPMTLAAIDFLMETSQWPQVDQLLDGLLADPKLADNPILWRLRAVLAEKRGLSTREVECLEQALALEFADLPDVINLEVVRRDYGKLLKHYESLAEAMRARGRNLRRAS